VMRIPLRAGRDLTADEVRGGAGVAVINEGLAQVLWPGQPPLGRRLRVRRPHTDDALVEVIGVSADLVLGGGQNRFGQVFVPYALMPLSGVDVIVRTEADPAAVVDELTSAIRSTSALGIAASGTVAREMRQDYFIVLGAILSVLAFVALTFAAAGLFGTMAYVVGRRRREIGIRMAVGASRAEILRNSLWVGLQPVATGVLLSSVGGFLTLGWLRGAGGSVLIPAPQVAVLPVAVALLAVGLTAALHPALVASRTDPAVPLRDG
jgi:putative ABC transport system permease protein